MIISNGILSKGDLNEKVAIITGAGRGIGYEIAQSLAWLGASIIIAEIDNQSGQDAKQNIKREFNNTKVEFFQTDVGCEKSVESLKEFAIKNFKGVDIIINNATITPIGSVVDVDIKDWDESYRVNLRGPVLLAKAFLPDMVEKGSGVFINVSSVGDAFMGAYETFKTAQVQLAETLFAEVGESGVNVLTVAPGLVHTPGANRSIEKLAPLYGKTEEEFFAMSKDFILSAEEAGAGFAAAVVLAEKYNGQEIGCKQALNDAQIKINSLTKPKENKTISNDDLGKLTEVFQKIFDTFIQQTEGWKVRPLFERQWMKRDFRKQTGLSVDEWGDALKTFQTELSKPDVDINQLELPPLQRLSDYYKHMQDLAKSYEKDPDKLTINLGIMQEWQRDISEFFDILNQ